MLWELLSYRCVPYNMMDAGASERTVRRCGVGNDSQLGDHLGLAGFMNNFGVVFEIAGAELGIEWLANEVLIIKITVTRVPFE